MLRILVDTCKLLGELLYSDEITLAFTAVTSTLKILTTTMSAFDSS